MDKPKYNYEGIFLNPRDIQQIVRAVNIQRMIYGLEQEITTPKSSISEGFPQDVSNNNAVDKDINTLRENFDILVKSRGNISQEIDDLITEYKTFGTIEENISSWKPTLDPHITTSFAGGKLPYESVGKQVTVTIDGYGYDPDKGLFALHVSKVNSSDKDINEAVAKTSEKTPLHITIANGNGSKPVQSRELFEEGMEYVHFEKPFTIQGSYGGFLPEQSRENPNIRIDILGPEERAFKEHVEIKLTERDDEFANSFRAANAKDPGDARLYLLQTMEQRIAGPTNFGSDFGKITPEVLFDKIADLTQIAYFQSISVWEWNDDDVFTVKYEAAKTEYEEKYGKIDFSGEFMMHDTTERDRKNGDTGPTNRTFEIPLSGNSGVIDIDDLPDTAIIYLDQVHGDSISVLATGIEKEPSDVTHLIFGTNKDGDCSFFLTAFPGPMKPPFELSLDTEYDKQIEISIAYGRAFMTRSIPIQQYDVFTKEEAKELGVTFVKYSPELPEPAKENLSDKIWELKADYDEGKRWEISGYEDIGKKIAAYLPHAPEEIKGNRNIVEIAVAYDGLVLQHASPEVQAWKNTVEIAVKQNGLALEYASPELQADKSVVMKAVSQNGLALLYASPELQQDPDILRTIICKDPDVLDWIKYNELMAKDGQLSIEEGIFVDEFAKKHDLDEKSTAIDKDRDEIDVADD